MCGIFGTTDELSSNAEKHILALLNHRGPDSHGAVSLGEQDRTVSLIHTRLAIQDLTSSGHQPMYSSSRRWVITFNGEIYNHFELRKNLNVDWRGTSDTETLAEYVDAFGVEAACRALNGIYAFGAYDSHQGVLYVCRDPFGVKPVYYQMHKGHLTFSSEVKPLLAMGGGNGGIDREALSVFLSIRYVPSPDTLFMGISRLPPGHILQYAHGDDAPSIRTFIQEEAGRYSGSLDEATRDYQTVLSQAVEKQLLSDVPVGVLLSGGIDSAVIAALASEHTDDLTAFTVGFGNDQFECEINDAADTARTLGLRHEVVEVDPVRLIDLMPDIVAAIEEPLGTTSVMPMWYLTQLARQHSTVVLAGQGNDEPWGGYRRYQIELLLARFPILKSAFFSNAGLLGRFAKTDGLRRGLQCLGVKNTADRFARAYSLFDVQERQLLGFTDSERVVQRIDYWLDGLDRSLPAPEQMMRIDTRMNLADDLLLYGDKVSMACALELRVPMLDPNVVRFVESLPLEYRASMSETKIVHRRMAAGYLPDSIINRPKKGFQVPFGEWSKSIWKDFVASYLLSPGLKIHSVLDSEGILMIWRRHQSARFDYSRQLFALLSLSLWLERYMSSVDASVSVNKE